MKNKVEFAHELCLAKAGTSVCSRISQVSGTLP